MATAIIDVPPTNPVGTAFQEWLVNAAVAGASGGSVSIDPAYRNVVSVTAPTQEWLHYTQNGTSGTTQLTFNTPIGASSARNAILHGLPSAR